MTRLVLCGLWLVRHRLALGLLSLVLSALFLASYVALEDNTLRFSLVVSYAAFVTVACSIPRIMLGVARYIVLHRNGKYDALRERLL